MQTSNKPVDAGSLRDKYRPALAARIRPLAAALGRTGRAEASRGASGADHAWRHDGPVPDARLWVLYSRAPHAERSRARSTGYKPMMSWVALSSVQMKPQPDLSLRPGGVFAFQAFVPNSNDTDGAVGLGAVGSSTLP